MNERYARFVVPGLVVSVGLMAAYIAFYQPGYLSSTSYLGGLMFLQVLLAAVWKYEKRFFPLLVIVFLWAGMSLPFSGVWTFGRWPVLAVGAIAGFALYMRSARPKFATFHLLAIFAVLAALVSAAVSGLPMLSFMKALSLLLLFLYAATGARLALAGREEDFFPKLLLLLEIVVYLSAVVYFVLRIPVFGNPNSMGAIMGVVAVPLLFWGFLTATGKTQFRRMAFALTLSVGLLFYSQARAGILAAVIVCGMVCVVLRRYRLMIQGVIAFVCVAGLVVTATPTDSAEDMPGRQENSSLLSTMLYKGHDDVGVLGSRRSAWDDTITVIQENPWFGSGFGTSVGNDDSDMEVGQYATVSAATREHGNSYLAIMEGVGLLGVVPFIALVVALALKVGGVFAWLRRTANVRHFSVPVAMVLAAGLIHAGFEDWLFAVGYYLSVFFWVLAFAFMDLLPSEAPAAAYRLIRNPGFGNFGRDVHVAAPER
jgi:O-antigen ligase